MVAEIVRRALLPAGLVLATIGMVGALYAYTGERIYDISWFYVLVGSFVFMVGGVLTSAYGRAMAPRGRAAKRGAKAAAAAPAPAAKEPVKTIKPRFSLPRKAKGPVERVTVQCPDCASVFTAEGHRPFTAQCPQCKLAAPIP